MRNKGFTLIELIIYVAIASGVLVSVITFAWAVIGSGVKVDVSSELTQNGRFVLEKITQEIHAAEDVVIGSSTFGVSPGVLTLDLSGPNTDVVFDTYAKDVTVGGQVISITKLRMQDGTDPAVDITSDKVNLTNFVLTNLTRDTEPANINIEITLVHITTGEDPLRDRNLSFETAVSIREK
ncbi:MAG: prepilin-type N-terminal cleavage/methylation domain-containing protein [Candidatus Peregrinibacteria bacterium]|nr:prepilin-type N-terminal cleavage/methylation domain-containing protein [Candidatus Peregrinibacteria bacterium]MDZ4244395.1 prepilin-type N-terminal cleavage/methylation domain-containing protein [Candidatus Gracilibacteria bacterium]